LLREHSRLKRASARRSEEVTAKIAREQCHKHFWRYASTLLDNDNNTEVSPDFSAQTAYDFFSAEYTSTPQHFCQPNWMPTPASPQQAMDFSLLSMDELIVAIRRSRPSSAPSPIDQIPYLVFKRCPSLAPALLDLFNYSLTQGEVPSSWKQAVFRLVGKGSARENPASPRNFRPIALTPTVSKLLSGILIDR